MLKCHLQRNKETLYNMYLEIQKLKDRKVISEKQRIIEPLLFSLCEMGCGVSLINEIMTLLSYFYKYGDYSTITGMLEKLRTIFETSKSLYSKIWSWRLTGKIFEEFWKRTITPPTQDTVHSLNKMFKNSNEWYTKETAIDTLCWVLRSKCTNLESSISDIYKLIFRGISDKVKDLRLSCTKALIYLIQGVNLLQELQAAQFQNILTTAIKGFSDSDEKVRCCNAELLKEIFCLKIKQLIDKNGSSTDSKMASSKKKLLESLPNDLLEVVQYLNNNIYCKSTSSNYERKCVVECINFIILEVPIVISIVDKEKLIEEIISLKPKDKSSKTPPERSEVIVSNRLVWWLLSQIIKSVEAENKIKILGIIIRHLKEQKLIESDLSILLNCLNWICQQFDWIEIFKSDQDLSDLLMPYLKSGHFELQISACEVVKAVSHSTSDWIHPLISTFVSHTSIAHAELAGQSFIPIYSFKIIPQLIDSYNKDEIKKTMKWMSQVNMLAHSLALIFSSVNHSLKGVPITLSNSSFNAAKAMILGNFQIEDDEEDIISINLNDFDISDSPRREAGWILLEGLLHLGNQWVGSKVSTIYKLWNTVFCKEMWEIDINRIKNKETLYIEKIFTEFKIK